MNISLPRFSNPLAATFQDKSFGISIEGVGALRLGRAMLRLVGVDGEQLTKLDEAIETAKADPKKKTVVKTGPIFRATKEEVKSEDKDSDKKDDAEKPKAESRVINFSVKDMLDGMTKFGEQVGRGLAEQHAAVRQAAETAAAAPAPEVVTPAPTQDLGQEIVSQAKVMEGSAGGSASTTSVQGETLPTEGSTVKVLTPEELQEAAVKLSGTLGKGGR